MINFSTKMYFIRISSIFRRKYLIFAGIIISIITIAFLIGFLKPKPNYNYIRMQTVLQLAEKNSFCSARSARRGFNQHVLSVSAYESKDNINLHTNLTWNYIQIFISEAKKFYPSWVVRIHYYNLLSKTKADIEQLESLYDNVDFCSIEDLPVLGNVRYKLPGKVQRFLPSIDPLVAVTLVRDLDSEIFEREVQAVDEWLSKTTYAFHIMRDHYLHNIEMPGGLWGVATNRLSYSERLEIVSVLLPSENEKEQRRFYKTYAGSGDQRFLGNHIWPLARRNALAHDSFTCVWSKYIYRTDTRPFPTQRIHPTCFVGCPKPCCTRDMKQNHDYSAYKRCPSSCRPTEHKDWLFC